jgi:hypothetical protein
MGPKSLNALSVYYSGLLRAEADFALKGVCQRCFADANFAHQEHDLGVSCTGLKEDLAQFLQIALLSHKRRRGSSERLAYGLSMLGHWSDKPISATMLRLDESRRPGIVAQSRS